MTELRVAHTADLAPDTLAAVRALLKGVFDDFDDTGWAHSLGGMHVIALADGAPIGHASVVQRQLLYQGRALRTGYVEGVAVRADRRRRGVGDALMASVDRIVRGGYELGALSSSAVAVPLYTGRGWQLWQGKSSAMTPNGVRPTEDDDGGIYVLPVSVELDLSAELTCDWRDGEVW